MAMKILVTGGAGFIGSHLIDALVERGHSVVCVDDLSLGRQENIAHHLSRPDFHFVHASILDSEKFGGVFTRHTFDGVFHMAANSNIQQGASNLSVDLEKTFMTTYRTLECMKKYHVRDFVFASSSAIYGERDGLLSEDSGPLTPISYYGAAKLASEAYISAFCENCSMRSWIFRFPNVVGNRATHGAVYDFINNLRRNPHELCILGDGTQEKPYLHVSDLIGGMLFGWEHAKKRVNIFNLGVDSTTTVSTIAGIVVEEMGLGDVAFNYSGGDRGWVGDVPKFQYSLAKIRALGWRACMTSDEAIRLAVQALLGEKA